MSTNPSLMPDFPFGAVYFRKSNPPREDWERDYRTAAEDGMNAFRHWFLWNAIEIAPGVYDWEEYDRQFDLAAQNGIKTVIAEMVAVAPEWAYRIYPHARLETSDGRKVVSSMHDSCAVGGKHGLCLDNDDFRDAAERFLTELVLRYKDHPGMGGYDVWNECGFFADTCYCEASAEKFRIWLQEKYGDLRTLGKAWHRYSFAEWIDVQPPRILGNYPDALDWLQFRIDNAYQKMRWRVELIRSLDDKNPITAHGVAMSLVRAATNGTDDWRAAAEVESYGYTWGSSRHGDEPWKQFHAVDLVRASSRGKPFWHAEAYGGPLWLQPNVLDKPRDEGRIASLDDIRYWSMVSFMAGATGQLYLRWRPLLDGPLFGAFGPYAMDGSRTERSERASLMGRWATAPEQAELWRSRPVKGDVGIVYAPETQLHTFAQHGSTEQYFNSMHGAYQGFFDNNIQSDWVHIDDLNGYDFVYLPFPTMLSQVSADKIRVWVEDGGTLVIEGCAGYFGDRGKVGTVQPNLGLDAVLGARESYVEFTPDLLGDLKFDVEGNGVYGGIYLQAYEPTDGEAIGWYEDGQVAAVDHAYGNGSTRVVGTMVGAGYAAHPETRSPAFFADLMTFAGKQQHITVDNPDVTARLHTGDGGTYLWVANSTKEIQQVRLTLSEKWGPFTTGRTLWGAAASIDGRTITINAPARDVSVIELM